MGHVASGMSSRDTRPRCSVSRLRITLPGAGPPGFQAAECRSSALPIGRVRSLFGTVSHASHQQALAGLSPLNFSRPRGFPSVPELVMPGRSASRQPSSRRWLTLNEPDVETTFGPDPVGGLGSTLRRACTVMVHHSGRTGRTSSCSCGASSTRRVHAASPTSSSTAARSCTARSVSVVPPPKRGITMR